MCGSRRGEIQKHNEADESLRVGAGFVRYDTGVSRGSSRLTVRELLVELSALHSLHREVP